MTGLLVIGGLLALLGAACWLETRSGKPAWGAQLSPNEPVTNARAATAAKGAVVSTLAMGAFTGFDGGDG